MSYAKVIEHFKTYLPLNSTEKEALTSRLTERIIKRRQIILAHGDVCRHYTFVDEGCFRMYYIDDKGSEHNLQFVVEKEWITDVRSFHEMNQSELYIEALEKSRILQISHEDLLYLYIHHRKFDRHFRVLAELSCIEMQKRILGNISSSAEERYLDFTEQYPHLINRISNVQIASYIGITPEFLSKIRKNLM